MSENVFGVEPTGNYHKPLGSYLVNANHHVVLVSGQAVKNNRILLDGRWDKHDTKCAANVADLISQGKCLFYDSPPEAIVELRSLLSLRRRLKKEEHSLRMRIRNSLLWPNIFRKWIAILGSVYQRIFPLSIGAWIRKKLLKWTLGDFFNW